MPQLLLIYCANITIVVEYIVLMLDENAGRQGMEKVWRYRGGFPGQVAGIFSVHLLLFFLLSLQFISTLTLVNLGSTKHKVSTADDS